MPIISLGNFLAPTKKKNSRTKEKTLHQNRERKQLQHTQKNKIKKNSNKKIKNQTHLKKTMSYKKFNKKTS